MINEKFEIYYNFLIEENAKYNLTAITERTEVEIKHFMDSLALDKYVKVDGLKVCDVGSGAGFPGIPLKIMHPSMELTIIEPTLKRCNFLKELCKKLDIEANIICMRAEDAKEFREQFDIVLARAVARLNVLLELCTPLVKVGGKFIAYKGPDALVEVNEAVKAEKELNMKMVNSYIYDLDNGYGKRVLIEYLKVKNTPTIYPRVYSKIKKNSL